MRFSIERRLGVWVVDDVLHGVGGWFVDLRAALRFIRQYDVSARVVVDVTAPAV
jgi:hypothetical protein